MAELNTIVDQLLIQTKLDDQAGAAADAGARKLDAYEASAQKAAAAVAELGQAADGAGGRITAATSSFDKLAGRLDTVTRAQNAVNVANDKLQQGMAAATREMASGDADIDAVQRTLAKLVQNLATAKDRLEDVRAEARANEEATAAWSGRLGEGAGAVQTWVNQVTAGAEAARALSIATQAAAQQQAVANASFAAIDGLVGKWVPLVAAQRQSIEAQAEINQLAAAGILTDQQAAEAIGRVTAAYVAQTEAAKQAAQAQQSSLTAQGQTAANSFAGLKVANVRQDATDYAARAADLEAYGRAMDSVRAKYDPLFAASKAYEAELAAITAAERTGAITAQQSGVAQTALNDAFAKGQPLSDFRVKLADTEKVSGAASAQYRNASIQAIQFASSVQGGIPIMTAAVQQGHQLLDSLLAGGVGFSAVASAAKSAYAAIGGLPGLLAGGLAVGLLAVAAAAETDARRLADLSVQLRATRADYAAMSEQATAAAKQAALLPGVSTSDARSSAQTLASSRYFQGTQADMLALIQTAQGLARELNTELPASMQIVVEAIDAPGRALEDLQQRKFVPLTAAIADNIQNMIRAGDTGRATAAILDLLRGAADGARTQGFTPLQTALDNLSKAWNTAGADGKSFGESLGGAVTSAIASAINNVAALVTQLHALKDALANLSLSGAASAAGSATLSMWRMMGLGPGIDLAKSLLGGGVGVAPGYTAQQTALLPQLQAASTSSGVDLELLRVLQKLEGQWDASTNTWKNSPTGPIGAMQVAPSTFMGMVNGDQSQFPGLGSLSLSGGMDRQTAVALLSNPSVNTVAGGALFGRLLQKYGNVYTAVLAWHDGESVVDDMLKNGGTGVSSAAIAEANAVQALYSGTGKSQFGPPASAANPMQLPTVSVNGTLSVQDRIPSDIEAANPLAYQQAQNALLQTKLAEDLKQATADARAAPGDAAAQARVVQLGQALADVRGKATDLITEQLRLARSAQDSVAPLSAESGASRALAQVQQQLVQVARSRGEQVDPAALAQAQAAKLVELAKSYQDETDAINKSTKAQLDVNAATIDGTASLSDLQNRMKATIAAQADFLPGTQQEKAAIDDRTAALNRAAAAAADFATKSKLFEQRDQLTYLQAETDTLGMSTDARSKYLAVLQATQSELRSHAGVLTDTSRAYIANVGAIADATASYQHQQQVLSDITGAFSSMADTLTNDVTQAFVQGQGAAVNWGNIIQGIETQIVGLIAKLTLINPLLNAIDGGTRTTLGDVGGLLGSLLGGGGTVGLLTTAGKAVGGTLNVSGSAANSNGLFSGAGGYTGTSGGFDGIGAVTPSSSGDSGGILSSLGTVGTLASLVGKVGGLFGGDGSSATLGGFGGLLKGSGTTGIAAVDDLLNTKLFSTGLSGPTDAAGQTVPLAAADDVATAAGNAGSSAAGGINLTVGNVASIAGSLYGVYSGIERGGVGGAVQAGAGVAGAALGAASAGLLGAGGYAAAAALGPYAPIAIAAIALLSAFLPGGHPKNPYSSVAVNAQGGQLGLGTVVSQIEDPSQDVASVSAWTDAVNQYLSSVNLQVANEDGRIGGVGNNITGFQQVADPAKLFSALKFTAVDTSTNFGLAEQGALNGMSFGDPGQLQSELTQIAGFAIGLDAIGAKLQDVGTDLTNIHIASLQSNGSDLSTALAHDLPGQTFADTDALEKEIGRVNDFVNGTVPSLLNPVLTTTSDTVQAVEKVATTYHDAITQAQQWGLATDDLTAAMGRAIEMTRAQAVEQLKQTNQGLISRDIRATSTDPADLLRADLIDADVSADQQRAALKKQWTDTYGDSTVGTPDYMRAMAQLEQTLGDERLAIIKKSNDAIAQAQQQAADQAAAAQAQALSAAQQSAASVVSSLSDYVRSLQVGSNAAASPLDQLALARQQFQAVAGAAQAGDANSISKVQGYAETYRSELRDVYGSGAGYAAGLGQIADLISGIAGLGTEAITQSFLAANTRDQTTAIVQALNDNFVSLQAEVVALRRELQLQNSKASFGPAQAA